MHEEKKFIKKTFEIIMKINKNKHLTTIIIRKRSVRDRHFLLLTELKIAESSSSVNTYSFFFF